MDYPLAYAQTKADTDNYVFPKLDAPGHFRDAEVLVKKYDDEFLVLGNIEVTVFSLAHQLVGMEKLLVDMMMETEYVVPLFEACAEFQTQIGLRLIKKGVDSIWFCDDFGTQQSLIMAPEIFRDQLKPIYWPNDKAIQRNQTRYYPNFALRWSGGSAFKRHLRDGFRGVQPRLARCVGASAQGYEKKFR